MYTQNEVVTILKQNKSALFAKYPISELALFGSYAKGDQNEESDIDLLIDFNGQIDGFEYIRLAHEFEDLFQQNIDLVTRRSINPAYLSFMERSLIHV